MDYSILIKYLLIIFLYQSINTIHAYESFTSRIPSAYEVPGFLSIGHISKYGGGSRDAFGNDFQKAGYKWTNELCKMDSDGDGKSNGEELGDPCCVWSDNKQSELLIQTHLSNPGRKDNATLAKTRFECNNKDSESNNHVYNKPEKEKEEGTDASLQYLQLVLDF